MKLDCIQIMNKMSMLCKMLWNGRSSSRDADREEAEIDGRERSAAGLACWYHLCADTQCLLRYLQLVKLHFIFEMHVIMYDRSAIWSKFWWSAQNICIFRTTADTPTTNRGTQLATQKQLALGDWEAEITTFGLCYRCMLWATIHAADEPSILVSYLSRFLILTHRLASAEITPHLFIRNG